jgi:hypothetical protein
MDTPTPAPAQPLPGAAAAPAAPPDTSPVDRALAAVAKLEAEHGPMFGGEPAAAPAAKPEPAASKGTPERASDGRFKPKDDTAAAEPPAEGESGEGDEPDLSDDDLEPGHAAGAGDVDDEDLDDDRTEGESDVEGDEPPPRAEVPAEVKRAQATLKKERAKLEADKTAFGQEVAALRGALMAAQRDLGAIQRLRSGDPEQQAAAIDELGIDAQELTLVYAQRGRPEAQQTKREKELAAKLAEQAKALEQLQQAQFAAQEQADRKRFTRDAARDTTYQRTAALARTNPDRLYKLAIARADELRNRGVQPTPALLMRGVERQLRDLGVPRPSKATPEPADTPVASPVGTATRPAAKRTPPRKPPPAEGLKTPPGPPSPSSGGDLTPEQRVQRAIALANAFGS